MAVDDLERKINRVHTGWGDDDYKFRFTVITSKEGRNLWRYPAESHREHLHIRKRVETDKSFRRGDHEHKFRLIHRGLMRYGPHRDEMAHYIIRRGHHELR